MHVYMHYMHVHIFMLKGTEQCVSYTWIAATYISCYHSTLMSLSGHVQLCSFLMFRIAAILEICIVNHFAASHQCSHNTERMESSAGRGGLLTNEQDGTVRAARRTYRQLHDRASAQSICERRDHKVT